MILFSLGSVDAHLDEVMQNPAYKDGEKQIIKILSSYFSSGCDGQFQNSILSLTFKNCSEIL